MTHRRTAAAVLMAIALPAASARRTLSTGILRWILSLALVFPLTVTLVPSQAAAVPTPSQAPAPTTLPGELAEQWCGTERASDFKPGWFSQDRPQIKVIYVFANDQEGEFQQYSHHIQKDIKAAVELVSKESVPGLPAGRQRSIAFDLGTDCGPVYVDIASIPLAKSSEEYQKLFGSQAGPTGRAAAIQKEVRTALGLHPSGTTDWLGLGGKRNFAVYANIGLLDRITIMTTTNARGDLPGCPLGGSHPSCKPDDQPGPGNKANGGGYWAWVWEQLGVDVDSPTGWPAKMPKGRLAMLHEITHNLGAVQDSAPHATQFPNRGHSTDHERDVMSHSRKGPPVNCYDCGKDDYFHINPLPGSYLDTHWNVARSIFMVFEPVDGSCFGRFPTNTPTPGNDIIQGTDGDDVLAGGEGDDEIRGRGGNDWICGDAGNDNILGGANNDLIDGGPGDDAIGGDGFQTSCGLATGTVGVFGGSDVIFGGPGRDTITGAWQRDALHGDDGTDCIMGFGGDDILTGGRGADFISAGTGHDIASGGDDYDEIHGQDGSDVLYAASSVNTPTNCHQSAPFSSADGPTEIGEANISGLKNFLYGDDAPDPLDGLDSLFGSNRTDNMEGDQRGDQLYGFAGNDLLRGNRGADCLSGGPGRDTLDEADPNNSQPDDADTLWGGSSPDELDARDGDTLDKLDGGSSIADSCKSDTGDVRTSC